ncbi:hypothetical protein [Maribellus sp. YY47]|uniref:hypothetical protein n=1 Tax=Maribellus sp. YY47 TaxID=2929486 RepID=UPI00200149B4|nr:hypothetical protein [Maribellus sp. YY47]MCK3682751.1 hypothetical protein [Maribellus sp. YY47]
MNRTITNNETQFLFEFCRKHYVYHYDLQVELVDHLASSIEEQWMEKPELSFENALWNSFRKFGISGFSKIKEQKQKELRKKYNRLLWKYLFDFFSWPKIVMTFAFTTVLATLFKWIENDLWIIVPYFGAMTIFLVFYYYRIYPTHYKIGKINGKKFMLLEQLQGAQFMTMLFIQVPIQIPNFWNISKASFIQSNVGIIFISLLIIVFTIVLLGQLLYLPEKIKEHFSEQFPEFAV